MKKYAGIFLSAAILCGMCGCDSSSPNSAEADLTKSETVLSVTEDSGTEVTTVSEMTETASEKTETFAETKTDAETVKETETAEPEYLPGEEAIISFLSYLQNGGNEWGYWVTYVYLFRDYDFMNDFKLDSYSYEHREDGIYDITLTCSESTFEMFPNGDSYWYADTNWHGNFIFYPAEKENRIRSYDDMINAEEPLKTAYFAAYDFSVCTGEFEADEEWFENYTDVNIHWLYHVYNPYIEEDEHGGVLIEDFINATKKLYNITIDREKHRDYFDRLEQIDIAEGEMLYPYRCGHGGSWMYEAFAGYDETDDEIKVRVDYYGDEIYFYPVIESEYTFSKNDDGTITLQRVEKLFDRGYKPAAGTI